MSCFICNKKYARLSSHLFKKHNIQGNTTEPNTIFQYASYLDLFSSPEAEFLCKYKKVINDCLHANKSLPAKLYAIMEKRLNEYKQKTGLKLVIQVATNTKQRRRVTKSKPSINSNTPRRVKTKKQCVTVAKASLTNTDQKPAEK